ncbi:MAG: hypothetical protein HZA50_05160 [Planctomycetes bacterium]|nr:hypothetical protein [Planctomycetota bacterium]
MDIIRGKMRTLFWGLPVFAMVFLFAAGGLAQEAASKPSELAEANRLMDEGKYGKAVEILLATGSAYMNEPAFFIALGRGYLGASNYSMASTALTTAVGKKADSAEAHLRLACVRALLKNFKGAFESIDQAARLDQADARISYARGLIHLLAGEYDKATPDIEAVGKTEGAFPKSVAGQLQDLAKFAKDQAELAAKRQKNRDVLKAAVDKTNADYQEAKTQWETANSDKGKLAGDRDREKDQAQRDYQTSLTEISRNYNTRLPAESLKTSNPSLYNSQKALADQYKLNAERDALQKRDQTFAGIENKYKPQIDALDRKMKDLSDQGVKLQGQLAKDKQKFAAQETQDKQYQPSWPFDVQAALRTLPSPAAAAAASQPAAVRLTDNKPS